MGRGPSEPPSPPPPESPESPESPPSPPRPLTGLDLTELTDDGWRVRVVQPYQAAKRYTCPGCNNPILPGVLHVVAWPDEDPESRRHWHRRCWDRHLTERRRAAERRGRQR